jgi:hypothetical protein
MKPVKTMLISAIFILALLASSANSFAGVVAIVNNANTAADKKMIGRLYSLEIKAWPDGARAILYDLSEDSEREDFCITYTGKSADMIDSNLAKSVFVGRSKPHKIFKTDSEIIDAVAKEKDAVGYVKESSLNNSVRVVH